MGLASGKDLPPVEANGSRLVAINNPDGVLLAAGRDDPHSGWSISAKWVVMDPAGDEYEVLVNLAGVAGDQWLIWPTKRTWPLDFPGAVGMSGPHQVSWIYEGTPVVSAMLNLRALRRHA
jgi:hypothetical protein